MSDPSRRRFLASLGIAALTPSLANSLLRSELPMSADSTPASRGVRVRAITAGVDLDHIGDRAAVERALELLARGKKRFEDAGYEVQTTRITMPPVLASLDAKARNAALASIDGHRCTRHVEGRGVQPRARAHRRSRGCGARGMVERRGEGDQEHVLQRRDRVV